MPKKLLQLRNAHMLFYLQYCYSKMSELVKCELLNFGCFTRSLLVCVLKCGALISSGELFCNTRLVFAIKDGLCHHLDEHLCRDCSDCSFSRTDQLAFTHWEHDMLPMIEWVLDDLDIRFE